MTYRVLSLFAGIGGFDLGLERTGGFKTVAFCEIDKKAQQVLRKHWPEVPIYDDVTSLTAEQLAADGIAVDVICGGFPCQDISHVGLRAGIDGERSGLWSEFARLIGELRPRYIILENVSALLANGMGRVLGDMAAVGYDAEWDCVPASAIGAPHRRDRVWLVGYPNGESKPALSVHGEASRLQGMVAHPACELSHGGGTGTEAAGRNEPANSSKTLADADLEGLEGQRAARLQGWGAAIRHAGACGWWQVEPPVGRVADGVPGRVDRLKQLGNAVVPQIPELIGRAIMNAEAA